MGFIVARKEVGNPEVSDYFIVTNKHVVEKCEKIFVRFNALEGDFVKDYEIVLTDGKSCFYSSFVWCDLDRRQTKDYI